MKRLRGLFIYLGMAWRLAPASTFAIVTIQTLASAASLLVAVGMRQTINGITGNNAEVAITGAILSGISLTFSNAGSRIADTTHLVVAQKVSERIDLEVLELCSTRPLLFLEDPQLLRRVEHARTPGIWMATAQFDLLRSILTFVQLGISLVLLASVDLRLTGLVLSAIPSLWTGTWAEARLRRLDVAMADAERTLRHVFEVSVLPGTAKELRLSRSSVHLTEIAAQVERNMEREHLRAYSIATATDAAGWLVFVAAFIAALLLTSHLVLIGGTTIGSLMLVVSLGGQLRGQIGTATVGLRRAGSALECFEEYLWLRGTGEQKQEDGTATLGGRLNKGIEIDQVTFAYSPNGPSVLSDVSLAIPAGATVALVGEHGSGKTSLVKLLSGLYAPTSGRILIDGVDLEDLSRIAWREHVTVAFQDFSRWEFTAQRSVGVGNLELLDDVAAVMGAVESVDGGDLVAKLDCGLKTQLGKSFGAGRELSGGEWQKLALARTFMRTRPLLAALDEPTASLDANSEAAVYQQYERSARNFKSVTGGITFLVSHRFATIRTADLIVVLDKGRIVECGSHEQLMDARGLYSRLYSVQAEAYR